MTIEKMTQEQHLRNRCRELEQQYVEWHRNATVDGCLIAHQWPLIGELGRYRVPGVIVTFVTTRKRSIQVKEPTGAVLGEVKMLPGMAQELYAIAGSAIDSEVI